MSSVKLVRDTYISVEYRGIAHLIGLTTKDIGCTIGTELSWVEDCERIAAYKPGTRYGDRAEECAAELVERAVKNVRSGVGTSLFRVLLSNEIKHQVSLEQPWNPDDEEDEEY
ncbi:hypothetical protein ABZ353_10785 [Streptomyces niveus]|uniref:hypothetical protein n=1 Tax=Streptomyces niveus TaxID=193462 RepID=UPI0033E6C334